jgi:SAM-dependent methyltransferase
MRVEPLPWDFESLVTDAARASTDLLDMGTGGGERLSRLPVLPALTVATEGWPPNVSVAARRLRPLGIPVLQVDGAPDNVDQGAALSPRDAGGGMPFRSASFHLVTNRHESFVASAVARVLAPGGHFLTQQVGSPWADEFYRLLDVPLPPAPPRRWELSLAVTQVEAAGLMVVASAEAHERRTFRDVGALAWYLKAVPWAIPGFSIDGFRPRLAQFQDRIIADGPLIVRLPHFWLEAQKRSAS